MGFKPTTSLSRGVCSTAVLQPLPLVVSIFMFPSFVLSFQAPPKSTKTKINDEPLSDNVFKNYDDFYYYDDDDAGSSGRHRRSVAGQLKPMQVAETCVNCATRGPERDKVLPSDYRKFMKFFLEDNPGPKCGKAGHAAYSDAVRLRAIDANPVRSPARSI